MLPSPMTLTPNPCFPRLLSSLCESSVRSAPAFAPSRSGRYSLSSSRLSRIAAHGARAALRLGTNHQPLTTKPFTIRTYRKHARNPFRIRTYKTQDLKPFRMNTYKKTGGDPPLCALCSRFAAVWSRGSAAFTDSPSGATVPLRRARTRASSWLASPPRERP
jgi:hypothetical protein